MNRALFGVAAWSVLAGASVYHPEQGRTAPPSKPSRTKKARHIWKMAPKSRLYNKRHRA